MTGKWELCNPVGELDCSLKLQSSHVLLECKFLLNSKVMRSESNPSMMKYLSTQVVEISSLSFFLAERYFYF